jgi:hypothetical protein
VRVCAVNRLKLLARTVNSGTGMTTNHLSDIATRERQTRVRDALFAVLVAITTIISMSSVAIAAAASR